MEDDPNTRFPDDDAGQDEESGRKHGAGREPITRERIAERAYLISQSDQAGSDEENWLRAEQELVAEQQEELEEG